MNYYEILGISETASSLEIKSAFKQKAKQYHPDLNKSIDAESMFKKVNEAYDVLKNDIKKANYDLSLNNKKFNDINMNDWSFRMRRPIQNKNIHIRYNITLRDSYFGKEAELQYSLPNNQMDQVRVIIPPSINDGATLRFTGKGDRTNSQLPPGDLFITIIIVPEPQFVRHGYDIITNVDIDFIDAITGTFKIVKCIDDTELNIRILSGLSQGSTIKVPDRGMKMPNGLRGNMLVEVNMVQPILTETQMELLKQIKKN